MFGKRITVGILGMHCSHCAHSVKENLEKIKNVKSVKVSLKNNNVTITYKENLSLDEVQNVIESLGYQYQK